MEYDYLVLLGRFEPFHNGHYAVVSRALKLKSELVEVFRKGELVKEWTLAEVRARGESA